MEGNYNIMVSKIKPKAILMFKRWIITTKVVEKVGLIRWVL